MLDIKLIRENLDVVKKDLKKRDMPDMMEKLDRLVEVDKLWRDAKFEVEKLKHTRNVVSREIAVLKKQGKKIEDKLAIVKDIPKRIQELDQNTVDLQAEMKSLLMVIPNILHDSVPVGVDDTQNKTVRKWGKPRKDKVKSHVDILEAKDLADTEKAGEVAGSRFYYLKGKLALLDLALQKFALDHLHKKGYTIMAPPLMLRRKPYEGVTSLDDFENVMYKIEGEDLYLIATSEHPLGAFHMDEVLDAKALPIKYAGISQCFRKEAGSHGKDTKGIFRVHHFNKIEQFVFCKPEESWAIHEELIKNAEELFQMLELPYRVVNICTGDIGSIAAKKYDLEVWMPTQKQYREAVSCSNCTDYQARRLNVKYTEAGKKEFVHTLNSTAIATGRTMVAILENFQDKDGNIRIPKALQKYTGFKQI